MTMIVIMITIMIMTMIMITIIISAAPLQAAQRSTAQQQPAAAQQQPSSSQRRCTPVGAPAQDKRGAGRLGGARSSHRGVWG